MSAIPYHDRCLCRHASSGARVNLDDCITSVGRDYVEACQIVWEHAPNYVEDLATISDGWIQAALETMGHEDPVELTELVSNGVLGEPDHFPESISDRITAGTATDDDWAVLAERRLWEVR